METEYPSLAKPSQLSTFFAEAGTKLVFLTPESDWLDRKLRPAHKLSSPESRSKRKLCCIEFEYDGITAPLSNVAYALRDEKGLLESYWVEDIRNDKSLLHQVRNRDLNIEAVELIDILV